jgi:ribosome maturation factor RimP
MVDTPYDHVKRMVTGVAEEAGFAVVEIQFPRYKSRQVVRVFIDKTGGVTLDDCKQVSSKIGERLDMEDPFPTRYTLEVSSPGVDRPLKTIDDFRRNTGRTLTVYVSDESDEVTTHSGVLKEVQGKGIVLETSKGKMDIDMATIVKGQICVSL